MPNSPSHPWNQTRNGNHVGSDVYSNDFGQEPDVVQGDVRLFLSGPEIRRMGANAALKEVNFDPSTAAYLDEVIEPRPGISRGYHQQDPTI